MEQIATLGLGEFYACYGRHITEVYSQPAWMDDDTAQRVARGGLKPAAPVTKRPEPVEEQVSPEEASALRAENAELRERIAELERIVHATGHTSPAALGPAVVGNSASGAPIPEVLTNDDLYDAIKRRLIAEAPALLKVLVTKPEIDVEVQRETVTADGKSWLGRVALLVKEGWFDSPRKGQVVFEEVKRRGGTGVGPRAYEACDKLLGMGFLTKETDGYLAVKGMKVNVVGNGR